MRTLVPLAAAVLAAAAVAAPVPPPPPPPAAPGPPPPPPPPPPPRPPRAPGRDLHGDPLPAGAVARLGTVRLRHGEHAERVVLSGDGGRVASAGRTALRFWDVPT